MMKNRISIIRATSEIDFQAFGTLLNEYAELRDYDEALGDIKSEILGLPGDYAFPCGCILLAKCNAEVVGGVALKKLADGICEMKRLYIREKFQKRNIGFKLVSSILKEARLLNYRKMRLDTHPWMERATMLYISVGFKSIPAYNNNPTPGIRHFEIDLSISA